MSNLIIENGSGVVNSNSWVTYAEYQVFAAAKGLTISLTELGADAELINAYDFIGFTYEQKLQGYRVKPQIQTGPLPRSNMLAYGVLVGSAVIPQDFKNSQMLAAASISTGVNINAVKDTANLASFSVPGVYSESYQSGASTPTIAQMPAVSRTLRPYTNAGASGGLYKESMGYL